MVIGRVEIQCLYQRQMGHWITLHAAYVLIDHGRCTILLNGNFPYIYTDSLEYCSQGSTRKDYVNVQDT